MSKKNKPAYKRIADKDRAQKMIDTMDDLRQHGVKSVKLAELQRVY